MTNAQLEAIFKAGATDSFMAGLRSVWNAGWYEGKGLTPTATSADQSLAVSKPVAVVKAQKR